MKLLSIQFVRFSVVIFTAYSQFSFSQEIVLDYSSGDDHNTTPIYTDVYIDISNNFYSAWDQFVENSHALNPEQKSQEVQRTFGQRAPVDHKTIALGQAHDLYHNLSGGVHPMPDGIEGWGYLLQGFNRFDDLDFGLSVPLNLSEILEDGATYEVRLESLVAGNSSSGNVGVGGGNTVNLAGVITDINPRNFDDSDGIHMRAVPENAKKFFAPMSVGSNSICINSPIQIPGKASCSQLKKKADGQLPFMSRLTASRRSQTFQFDKSKPYWLYVNGHSGFEGFSSFYIQRIKIQFNK